MKAWSPRGLGLLPLPFSPTRTLTTTEGNILDRLSVNKGLIGLYRFKAISDEAFAVASAYYPSPARDPKSNPPDESYLQNDGHRDAFRHAYWNILLTREFGEEWTRQYTTAHEALPGNFAVREAMDLFNNEVGRQIATANPGVSKEKLGVLLRNMIDNGSLIVVDKNGNIEWSNNVPLWKHGVASNVSRVGIRPVPEGNVSAK